MKKIKAFKLGGFALALLVMILVMPVMAEAAGKVTVTVSSANVRANATTSSSAVGGVKKGDVLEVISTETDSAGYTWYKITLSSTVSGYIRGDLVTYDSGDGTTATTTTTTTTTSTSTTLEETVPTVVEPVEGTVSGDVRVRAGASTKHDIVTTAKAKQVVTVIGYATGTDNKVWYNITYTSGNDTITGYIRSDYIKLSGDLVDYVEPEPEPEPEVEEEPEPEPEPEVVYKDYEAVYSESEECWYLNNYIEGTRNKVDDLYKAQTDYESLQESSEKALKKKNVLIGVLIFIIVALLAGAGYAFIKVRQWMNDPDADTEAPANSYVRNRENTCGNSESTRNGSTSRTTSNVQVQTVGGSDTANTVKPERTAQTVGGGVRLPDGRIQMPDGSIRRAVVGVRLADGSIRLPDGRIRKTDGTIVSPESTAPTEDTAAIVTARSGYSTQSSREVGTRQLSNDDDDMEFGFLNFNDKSDEE